MFHDETALAHNLSTLQSTNSFAENKTLVVSLSFKQLLKRIHILTRLLYFFLLYVEKNETAVFNQNGNEFLFLNQTYKLMSY